MTPRIAVIDYGAGNLRSIRRALEAHGAQVTVTPDPAALATADGILFPGVGNAGAAMRRLHAQGMPPAIADAVAARKPFLGICLGMQLLFEQQEEGATHGLGLLRGEVRSLRGDVKVPQIGWNRVTFTRDSPLGAAGDAADFYFVHSYVVVPAEQECVAATADYGETFPAIVAQGNVIGAQFHPEKSGAAGLELVASFVAMARENALRQAAASAA